MQHINSGLRLRRATEIIAGTVSPPAAPEDLFAFAYVAPPPGAPAGAWRYDQAGSVLIYTPRYGLGGVRYGLSREPSGLWVLAPQE